MSDQFLNDMRRDPRPEFAAGLRERLRRQPAAESAGEAREPQQRLRPAWLAAAAALAALAGVMFSPSLRASAQAFLDLFRVQRFTAVSFDPDRMERLRSMQQNNALMVFDRQEALKDPGMPQPFPTPEAAGAAAGMVVRVPDYLPRALTLAEVTEQAEGRARLGVSTRNLRELLDGLDLRDVQVPPGLDDKWLEVHMPPVVIQRYRSENFELELVQANSPEVGLPSGVDLAQMGEIGLRILGLDAREARRLAQSIDWRTTLLVPVPANASAFREITVRGKPGLLITLSEVNAKGKRRREGTLVLWTETDRLFALEGNLSSDEMIQVAESVR